jgi:two-component SAPR family response regulator
MSSSSSTTRTRDSVIPLSYYEHPSFDHEGTTFVLVATILIVDPDAANRSLLELLCLRLGHRPIGSREWVEGEEPDLMLLEPASRPGLRLARGVRGRLPQLPILCVSIDGPNRETSELESVGHVMKPFRRSQLERALEQALIPAAVPVEDRLTA